MLKYTPKHPTRIGLTLYEYSTNIYLCWECALPNSMLLSISRHFKRFQLNDLLSQLSNLATFFHKLLAHFFPEFFDFYRSVVANTET